MLIPRFTVRQLLLITAASALVALAVSEALRGQAWALAVSMAVGGLAVAVVVSVGLFFVAWLISLVFVSSPPK
jgi:hypothetical protein